jgi:hypothetical protein
MLPPSDGVRAVRCPAAAIRTRSGERRGANARGRTRSREVAATASAIPSRPVSDRRGTNGTTSSAPSRGCMPRCGRRSMAATVAAATSLVAASTASSGPARVRTERLCSGSECTSNRCAPATPQMVLTISGSRPSLMLTTHSACVPHPVTSGAPDHGQTVTTQPTRRLRRMRRRSRSDLPPQTP